MKTLVTYHSEFGNTRAVAETIGEALRAFGPVRVAPVADVHAGMLDGYDLFVVGGPTQAHGLSPQMRPLLNALVADPVGGRAAATFDTRIDGPAFLTGSAAKAAGHMLQRAGFRLVVPPESFLVRGAKPPQLVAGEQERAGKWATAIGADVSAGVLEPVG